MRSFILFNLFFFCILSGCDERHDQGLTQLQVQTIADSRYRAHALALGVTSPRLVTPAIQYRETDTEFLYIEPSTRTTIVVIVEKSGQVADGAYLKPGYF